jgi:phage gp29-like protein
VAREWVVNEADESPEADAAAELVRRHISKLSFDRATKGFLDAVNKGFAVGEVMWAVDEDDGSIRPAEIRFRKQQRFTFTIGEDGYELRLLTTADPFKGEALPERKFIRFTFDERYENPYGFGLGNSLFWPVFFKRKGITFWLVFCDKYGTPTTIGKYPTSATPDERRILREALEAIANDSGVTVPQGMEVSLLEAARSGIDTYEKLVRYMDEQISEVVLGETGTTNQSGTGGSNARDRVGNEVRLETAKSDADALCEVLNNTLVKWIIDLNMPGAPYPKLWRNFEEPEDLVQKADRDTKLGQTGVKFKKSYYMREYNLQEDDFDLIEPSQPSTDLPTGRPVNFAAISPEQIAEDIKKALGMPAPGERKAIDARNAVEDLISDVKPEELQKQAEGMLAPIIKLIEDGQSYEQIMADLVETYDGLSFEALTEMLERAYFIAAVWGRINAR